MALPYLLRQREPREEAANQVIEAETRVVEINDFKFVPARLAVKKGTTVTWTNKDAIGHTVTGERGGPDSAIVNQNKTYTYTFNETGELRYFCKPHPFMRGTIEVVE